MSQDRARGAAVRATDLGIDARAEASRRNGAKARGPKTEEGKRRSARNALRHGLRAQRFVVLRGEDEAAYEAFEMALRDELAPEGVLESLLVSRIANAAWRMQRADWIEADLLDQGSLPDPRGRGRALGKALIRDGHGPRVFETLLRYRGAVQAEFWRSLAALNALRAGPADAPDRNRSVQNTLIGRSGRTGAR